MDNNDFKGHCLTVRDDNSLQQAVLRQALIGAFSTCIYNLYYLWYILYIFSITMLNQVTPGCAGTIKFVHQISKLQAQ